MCCYLGYGDLKPINKWRAEQKHYWFMEETKYKYNDVNNNDIVNY